MRSILALCDPVVVVLVSYYCVDDTVTGVAARSNIMSMAASLLACGIDHNKSVLFQQSAVSQCFNVASGAQCDLC